VSQYEPLSEQVFRQVFTDGNRIRKLDQKNVRDLISVRARRAWPSSRPLTDARPTPAAAQVFVQRSKVVSQSVPRPIAKDKAKPPTPAAAGAGTSAASAAGGVAKAPPSSVVAAPARAVAPGAGDSKNPVNVWKLRQAQAQSAPAGSETAATGWAAAVRGSAGAEDGADLGADAGELDAWDQAADDADLGDGLMAVAPSTEEEDYRKALEQQLDPSVPQSPEDSPELGPVASPPEALPEAGGFAFHAGAADLVDDRAKQAQQTRRTPVVDACAALIGALPC
jgi:hypothetical protein